MNLRKVDRPLGLTVGLTVFIALIIFRILYVQTTVKAQNLAIGGTDGSVTEETAKLQSVRGSIYDRWGSLLAGNQLVYEVAVDLRKIDGNEQDLAMTLSSILNLDFNEVLSLVNQKPTDGRINVTIERRATSAQVQQLSDILWDTDPASPNLAGINWFPYLQRVYPEGELASTLLGYVPFNHDSRVGYFGVEEKHNNLLAGKEKIVTYNLDPYKTDALPDIPPGASIILTIDREIQAMAEKKLDQALASTRAQSGTIIIEDPRSGEILAMASSPRMDPNDYISGLQKFVGPDPYNDNKPGMVIPFNKAITGTYEPGSVFKVLTMAAALDSGLVTPDTTYLETGVIEVGGVQFYNWDRAGHGTVTMTQCMQLSLNVCLAHLAKEMGPTTFYSYLEAFGIGHRTNIDLAGEAIFPVRMDLTKVTSDLGANAFGQGISVTPIQMVMAISAVANDGRMMAPHVMKAFIKDDQQVNINPVLVNTPISAETAHTLTEMLAISLEKESSDALVEGYRVAGKTGTAEIVEDGQYSYTEYNASFVGWGPTDDPRFLVYIWLERPRSAIWGSVVAAPLFSEVVQELVILMDLPPDDIRHQLEGK